MHRKTKYSFSIQWYKANMHTVRDEVTIKLNTSMEA